MPYPNDFKTVGSGAIDNEVICTTSDVSSCNEHTIQCMTGTIDVEISIDEGQDATLQWSDSGTFPIAVMLLNATNPSTWVTELTAGQFAVLTGRYDRVRLKQKGAPASSGRISSYSAFRR